MNFLLCLLIAFNLNAQEGTGFQEIDPKKDAVILKRLEAEKLLKKMAAKKKAESLQAEAKRTEEEKKLAEEKKKKEVEETTRWLLAEKERKIREAEFKKKEEEQRKQTQMNAPSKSVLEGAKVKESILTNRRTVRSTSPQKSLVVQSDHKCRFPEKLDLPSDVKILGVGTYEGTFPGGRGFQHHPMTDVTVTVKASGPIALVIFTYEPVRWKIKSEGADIRAVAVIGYHKQEIEGIEGIPLLTSSYEGGNYICRYKDSPSGSEVSFEDRTRNNLQEFSAEIYGKKLSGSFTKYSLPADVIVKED